MEKIGISLISMIIGLLLIYITFQFGCTKNQTSNLKVNTNLLKSTSTSASLKDDPYQNARDQFRASRAETILKPKAQALDEAIKALQLKPVLGKINDGRIMKPFVNEKEVSNLIEKLTPKQHLLLNYVTNAASYFYALNNRCPEDVNELIGQGFIPFKSTIKDIQAINPVLLHEGWYVRSDFIVKNQDIINNLQHSKQFSREDITHALPVILFNNVSGNLFSEYIKETNSSFFPTFKNFISFLDNFGGVNEAFNDCFLPESKTEAKSMIINSSEDNQQLLNEFMFGSSFYKNEILMIYTSGTKDIIEQYGYSSDLIGKVVKINYFIIKTE